MSLSLTDISPLNGAHQAASPSQPDAAEARRAASEFEALLLSQLTSSLNPTEKDEEDALFGGESGSGVYRQMFNEQIASTMAKSGGIGLADLMLGQMQGPHAKAKVGVGHERAFAAARDIKSDSSASIVSLEADNSNASLTTPDSLTPLAPVTRPRRVFATSNASNAASLNRVESNNLSVNAVSHVALQSPVHGVVRSNFGPRIDPINGRHSFHQGVDLAVPRGTPIAAAGEGEVVFAGRNRGYGNMVVIQHADGRVTRYAHAERLFVKRGDFVSAGQTIAAVGSTGHSTGPHLHFEVFENGAPVNPLRALANDATLARR